MNKSPKRADAGLREQAFERINRVALIEDAGIASGALVDFVFYADVVDDTLSAVVGFFARTDAAADDDADTIVPKALSKPERVVGCDCSDRGSAGFYAQTNIYGLQSLAGDVLNLILQESV